MSKIRIFVIGNCSTKILGPVAGLIHATLVKADVSSVTSDYLAYAPLDGTALFGKNNTYVLTEHLLAIPPSFGDGARNEPITLDEEMGVVPPITLVAYHGHVGIAVVGNFETQKSWITYVIRQALLDITEGTGAEVREERISGDAWDRHERQQPQITLARQAEVEVSVVEVSHKVPLRTILNLAN